MFAHFPISRTILLALMLALALAACSKPLSHDELLGRAEQALDEGKLNAAVIDVKTALQQDKTSAPGRRLLGEVLLRQRKLDEAAIEFGKSLASAEEPSVAALYAQALLGSGQQDELLDLQQNGFFAFAADEPAFLASLARAQATIGDTFTAEQTIEAALAIDPDNPQVQLAQAAVLARHTGEFDEARNILGN